MFTRQEAISAEISYRMERAGDAAPRARPGAAAPPADEGAGDAEGGRAGNAAVRVTTRCRRPETTRQADHLSRQVLKAR